MVIFGSPGLVKLYDACEVAIIRRWKNVRSLSFPVLPSIVTAGPEVRSFVKKGHVNFSDEVTLGTALSRVLNTPKPMSTDIQLYGVNVPGSTPHHRPAPSNGIRSRTGPHLYWVLPAPLVEEFTSTG